MVSALLWGGPPRAVLTAAREQRITLYTSAPLIAELEDVLSRDKLARRFAAVGRTPADALNRYLALVRFVTPAMLEAAVSRDPDDDQVLATAIAANAELIVSGDRDLLDLGHFRAIRIIDAAAAVEWIAGAAP
ncbi:MAG: putative toxin-antitoxin system toxin component, PIN family [Xanthomonadaceae bacterium]|nr:putative toxin-antitoxin system toxin component, PIN family [Xanthomonadaceae bacterium]MDP2185065.1 putative toxin-antitoxin system toxin component, PIN family [Xanthomonadales bacterium]MDZ4117111.1 putative toxin-antitoxin system toxin component, PIN family [Xanthomonadaceae bacterium]MDZ4378580.1 putative toxin-antitoxin system toxin component, PIN family [Xanthomonadaceae bacterium]